MDHYEHFVRSRMDCIKRYEMYLNYVFVCKSRNRIINYIKIIRIEIKSNK